MAEVAAEELTNAYLYVFLRWAIRALAQRVATNLMLDFLDDPTRAPTI